MKEIIKTIQAANSIAVVSHVNPDPDAYGSSCALSLGLIQLGKSVVTVNETGILDQYRKIPRVNSIVTSLSSPVDLIIVCDCGDSKRVGDTLWGELQAKNIPIINIDHHNSNSMFGEQNCVRVDACSTCEIIFELLENLGVSIDTQIATALLCGLYGDTGSFRNGATTGRAFDIASKLIAAGASAQHVSAILYEGVKLSSFQLRSNILSNVTLHCEGKIVEFFADEKIFEKFNADPNDVEGIVELGRCIEGVLVSVFIRKAQGVWRVSLRSSSNQHDVSQIAAQFGGGGHKMAAAFRNKDKLEDFKEKLFLLLGTLVQK